MKLKLGRVVVTILIIVLVLILIVSGAIEIQPKDFFVLVIGIVVGYFIRGAVSKWNKNS